MISYANMAHAAYKDSLDTAKALQTAVETYVTTPTQANLDAAKAAYKARASRIRKLRFSVLMKAL